MATDHRQDGRLIVVSNRLPIVLERSGDDWNVEPGSGGLVTAMEPVLEERGGVWVGWPGIVDYEDADLDRLLDDRVDIDAYDLEPVLISEEERDRYYYGFSNETLWPIFHDLQSRSNFDPAYWRSYVEVNRKFASVIAEQQEPEDFIWIHDYHLMYGAAALRERGVDATLAYFLHIPFPPPDIYVKLPWREQILEALLQYDLLGFQTLRDQRNFVQCIAQMDGDIEVEGEGNLVTVHHGGRTVRVGAFPISIDYRDFAERSAGNQVAKQIGHLRKHMPDTHIMLGVDRLDYTKGLPFKLEAFRNALERYPELREEVVLVQVVVPSREGVPEYDELKTEIEQLVGEINGQFTQSGWVPIHFIYRSLDQDNLLAYYRTAEAVLATPLKDGMNLVAKEYCASSIEEVGVLVLSEFAGAASQLGEDALLVNPYDVEATAERIREAYHMSTDERRSRMQRLRKKVRETDIFWWVNSFLDAAPNSEPVD